MISMMTLVSGVRKPQVLERGGVDRSHGTLTYWRVELGPNLTW